MTCFILYYYYVILYYYYVIFYYKLKSQPHSLAEHWIECTSTKFTN